MVCGSSNLLPNESIIYDHLAAFYEYYHARHIYITMIMTIFSTAMNVLNFVVLTRPSMINSINAHLAAIAIADFMTLFLPLTFLIQEFRGGNFCPNPYAYTFYVVYIMGYGSFVAHSLSMWLSVFMAFTRFITLRSLTAVGSQWYRSTKVAWLANVGFAAGIAGINIPMLLMYEPHHVTAEESHGSCNNSGYEGRGVKNCVLATYVFWQSGVLFKIVPCILLVLLSAKLLRVLKAAQVRRQLLSGALMIKATETARKKERATDRTTKMMVTMLIVFLACEIPQGILYVSSGILGPTFMFNVQYRLGDVLDFLSQINCSVNFVIYCTMSEAFREEFSRLFLPKWPEKRVDQSISPNENQTLLPKDNHDQETFL